MWSCAASAPVSDRMLWWACGRRAEAGTKDHFRATRCYRTPTRARCWVRVLVFWKHLPLFFGVVKEEQEESTCIRVQCVTVVQGGNFKPKCKRWGNDKLYMTSWKEGGGGRVDGKISPVSDEVTTWKLVRVKCIFNLYSQQVVVHSRGEMTHIYGTAKLKFDDRVRAQPL